MKKCLIVPVILLSACAQQGADQYVANMYANGTLHGYGAGEGSSCNANCPGCHVKSFDRVKLTVEEVLSESGGMMSGKVVDGCQVSVDDSLHLINVSASRYIPVGENYGCERVFEKERAYLKAMGFSE